MTPSHHPDDEFLVDYAAGNLVAPLALVVATHAALCPACRETISLCEAIGGALLAEGVSATMSTQASDRAIVDERSASVATRRGAIFPAPIVSCLGMSPVPWRRVLPGISIAKLTAGASGAWLLRMKPGARVPRHTHAGLEMTCMLDGTFEDGERHRRGDFAVRDSSQEHVGRAGPRGCVCLVGIDGPVRLTGTFGRALNSFMQF